jgi:antitoxin (DNA-binding transcriptional repressor) of toxin-antitoxin stability system
MSEGRETKEVQESNKEASGELVFPEITQGESMTTVTLEEAQARLPELIERLTAGDQLLITRNQLPIARLTAEETPKRKPRKAGSAKGMLTILADDDEHLKDFSEYME